MKRLTEVIRTQMKADRESGMTLTQLAKKYGRSTSTISFVVKGCDASKVCYASPGKRIVQYVAPKDRPPLSTTDIGEAARQMICARLMLNGVKVFRPMTEDTPIDLLVLKGNGETKKCQCKYLYPTYKGTHVLKCYSAGRGKSRGVGKHLYSENEVDFFLGYCWDNDAVYIVPRSITAGRQECHFWILRSPVGDYNGRRIDEREYRGAFHYLK